MNFESFRPDHESVLLIGALDEFKGSWRSISSINTDRLASLKKVATIESIGSSTRIEGASLSDEDVEILLSGLKKTSFKSRDEEEVAGYAEAVETVYNNFQTIPLTQNHIKQLHGILLQFSSKDDRHRGNYKTIPNHVEAFDEHGHSLGTVFHTASPFDTPFRMTALVEWEERMREEKKLHPLFIIAAFKLEFLAIHPFQDGNGRLSRVLTILLLLKHGYSYVPYSSLESVIESNKDNYYLALRRTQTSLQTSEPDWTTWIIFFLKAMTKQKTRLEDRIKRERLLQGALPPLSTKILELARERGSVKTADVEALTGENRSTIVARLKELMKNGYLVRNGRGPATWYSLSQK